MSATKTILTGYEALEAANAYGVALHKYADPTEGALYDVDYDYAAGVVREDPGLVWCEVTAEQAAELGNE